MTLNKLYKLKLIESESTREVTLDLPIKLTLTHKLTQLTEQRTESE